jgi:hypothetical protein
MVDLHRGVQSYLIAKSSKEQVGYKLAPDTSGARLRRAPEGRPGRLSRQAKNEEITFWFQAGS